MGSYKEGLKTSIITIIINIVLSAIKIIAGIIGKSSAMLADGVHTLSDVLTTFVVLIGLKVSSKEADDSHPYGHEKYEPIFAKWLSIILAFTGVVIGYEGIKVLINGNIKIPGSIALVAAAISIIIKEGMYRHTLRTAKKIKSFSMEADAWHHRSDALSSIGTFIGILGARMGLRILDPIAAVIVSVFIIKVGIDLYFKSIGGLVDESADKDTIEKIEALILSVKGVKRIRDLKTRIFGSKVYVDIDIIVDGDITVTEGHNIAEMAHDLVEKNIEDIKHCMVHVEPDIDK
ncbi:MAG TPA: cation diffusion facilitator family transporter [Tissierellaceae bacterium]|nr:cation diffusion facilitator family transporter [Tissierellaceae bacterium]